MNAYRGRDAAGCREMNCDAVHDRLPLVPGADLLPDEDTAVRAHLAKCVRCRADLGAFVRARQALRSLAPEEGMPLDSFFTSLRQDTLAAVRRDAWIRDSRTPARRSIAGMMTAAALFLLGVYLVPLWLPDAPERARSFPELPPIFAPTPEHATRGPDPRFRNVGYGLMGHRERFPSTRVPLGAPASGADLEESIRTAIDAQSPAGRGAAGHRSESVRPPDSRR